MRIFDPEMERAAVRPRGLRPEVPVPFPTNIWPGPNAFGSQQLQMVSDHQALGLPAAWRAVNLVANGVATMSPLDVYDGDGVTKLDTPPLCARPNSLFGTFDFFHQAVATCLMRGNFVGIYADFDTMGYPRQVVPVPLTMTWAYYDADGLLKYSIAGKTYTPLEVMHVRAFALPDSPWGIGVVENFRRQLGLSLEQQNMAADVYHRGSVPSGVIETDRPRQDTEQAQEVQDQWIDAHGGGQRKPAVLPQGWKFTPLSWSPEDAQFLESRGFSVAEIAFMFGLDPTDLGAAISNGGSSITYANVEQRQIDRVIDSYGPWMRRFEEAFTDAIPASQTARFNPRNLLRMDAETAAKVHQVNIVTGLETVDEARAIEGKPPLPKPPAPQPDPALPLAKEGTDFPASSAVNPDGTTPPMMPAPTAPVSVPAHTRQMPVANGAK